MEEKYTTWITTNVPTIEAAFGACIKFTQAMCEDFPELTPVYGNYYCPMWGERWHQWLVTPTGKIVDPTAHQFPSKGTGEYVWRSKAELPKGKCANCGELYFEYYDGTVCSVACGAAFVKSLHQRW